MSIKTTKFRALLGSADTSFICEAHNGISAKIVEEAGFQGIWASGLSISAQFGVRDNNEASWTQVLDHLEFMTDATSVPIMLDGDTGFGNFNNMRRLVRKLEQRDVAAVCIEDKLYPKTNSFIAGDAQPLAEIDEFCGKIKAGKDAQSDDGFAIVARVEAFIAGWGLTEALRRAGAYHQAGADAILIHSALTVPDEVLAFKREWGDRCPVVIVPTKYYGTPTQVFRDHGFALIIWANHILRSAITAMQSTTQVLFQEQNLLSIEDRIVPVKEVFRLQGAQELQEAEQTYLPQKQQRLTAVVLAASRGAELGALTEDRPKAMVRIGNKPLLQHIADGYMSLGVKDVVVVRGYRKSQVDLPGLSYVDNDDYSDTGELSSLARALEQVPDSRGLLISYGDVLFHKFVPQSLIDFGDSIAVPVDTNWRESANRDRKADYVSCSCPSSRESFNVAVTLEAVSDDALLDDMSGQTIHGEWMGLIWVPSAKLEALRALVAELVADPRYQRAKLPVLLNELVARRHEVRVSYLAGHWLDIDSLEDVVRGSSF